jgi:hypothetical protein
MQYIISKFNLSKVEYLLTFDKNTLMVHIEFPNQKIDFSLVDITEIFCDISYYKLQSTDSEHGNINFGIKSVIKEEEEENEEISYLIKFPTEHKISTLYVIDLYEKVKKIYEFKHTDEYDDIRLKQFIHEYKITNNIDDLHYKYRDIADVYGRYIYNCNKIKKCISVKI